MTAPITRNKIGVNYISITALAVILSWVLHEFAHWCMGTYLGYDMTMTLNKAIPKGGTVSSNLHYQILSAGGPLFTLAEAIFIFVLMRGGKRPLLYPFLFTCFYMRLFAALISFLNPNDEARISKYMGLGMFTLPLIMTAILFVHGL